MWSLVLAALASYVAVASACSCLPLHPQQQFCDSDFVLKVRPISVMGVIEDQNNPAHVPYDEPTINTLNYTVEVLDIFKGGHCKQWSFIQVFTSSFSGTCGVELMLSQNDRTEWLITGHWSAQERFEINSCGFNRVWSSLSLAQIRGLKKVYKRGCQCKICIDMFCHEEGKEVCRYPIGSKCHIDDYCKPKKGSKGKENIECSWSSCDQVTLSLNSKHIQVI